jgi:ATP-dependent DNA helicase RecG
MLTEKEFLTLMTEMESDRVEKTESIKDTDKFSEAICAFSNDFPRNRKPGYLLIGVNNNGKAIGLKVSDQLLLNLAAIRSDGNIQPMPTMTVQRHILAAGEEVAVIEVTPSDLPPVRYKGQVWIRVGPRRAIASEQEERILTERRVSHAKTFDARPCEGSSLQDLALDIFLVSYRINALAPEIIEENHRDVADQLASLRFYDSRKKCATNAGALLFAKDPLRWLPGAYIQYVRFDGNALTDQVLKENIFSGDLLSLLRTLDGFIAAEIEKRPSQDSLLHETMVQDYPLVALRELLMNAVMHRSYDSNAPIRFYCFKDRIEIQSPGPLYGEATAENFPRQNAYRNPVVAEAMHALGYANRYGRGVARAQEALLKNGNSAAIFEFQPTFVLATIKKRQ